MFALAGIWTQDFLVTKSICYQLSYPGFDQIKSFLQNYLTFQSNHFFGFFKVAKKWTQGYSVMIGTGFDIASDVVTKNASAGHLQSLNTAWRFPYLFGGTTIGFGLPIALGLPDYLLFCNSSNFLQLLDQYQLNGGVTPLLDSGFNTTQVRYLKVWVMIKESKN